MEKSGWHRQLFGMIRILFAVLGLLVCPAVFIRLCARMRKSGIQRPPYIPFFLVLGTVGGWMLALGLSPSGLTAVSLLFLATVAPLALVASSIYLVIQSERSGYHRYAVLSGFMYAALLAGSGEMKVGCPWHFEIGSSSPWIFFQDFA
jgi:hypothetical protein